MEKIRVSSSGGRGISLAGFVITTGLRVVAVRTMSAPAATTIAALQVVFLGKYDVALGTVVKVLGIERERHDFSFPGA
jgi:hypothetical protein